MKPIFINPVYRTIDSYAGVFACSLTPDHFEQLREAEATTDGKPVVMVPLAENRIYGESEGQIGRAVVQFANGDDILVYECAKAREPVASDFSEPVITTQALTVLELVPA